MSESMGDKTFEPTPHRRQQARLQGHVARSSDLCSAGVLLLGLAILMMLGGGVAEFLMSYCRQQLGGEASLTPDADFAIHHWMTTLWGLGRCLLPILGLLLLAGVAVNVAQIGILFLPEKLSPDPARIDPLQGMQRLFSVNNAVRVGFGLLKTAVVLAAAFIVVYGQREAIVQLAQLEAPQLALQATRILMWTAIKVGGALLLLSILDFAYQWWKHEQDLKMTPQELREELRDLDGNPQVIARRKQMQREGGGSRNASAVPLADVILIDPAGLAVAVRYDPDTMSSPVVLAKGVGAIAKRIRESAAERRIVVVENPPLTQALYRKVAVNGVIPSEHYHAVAEVLLDVYRSTPP
jgi:flagellar biosynthetic protein FlhB